MGFNDFPGADDPVPIWQTRLEGPTLATERSAPMGVFSDGARSLSASDEASDHTTISMISGTLARPTVSSFRPARHARDRAGLDLLRGAPARQGAGSSFNEHESEVPNV